MENKKHIAIKNPENVCFNCLKETEVTEIHIHEMGYGSGFDGWSTKIRLCKDCMSETDSRWWELKEKRCDWDKADDEEDNYGFYEYEFEDEIFEFIHNLPIEGKELLYNRFSRGWNSHGTWEPQDYIDYDLKILPHEKCKEYGVYSHQEIEAYKTKFPVCQHPVNKVYSDGSKGCWCPFGAHGDYGQKAGLNICDDCYKCNYFLERTTPIRDINNRDYNEYSIYYVAKLNADKYKNKFE